SRKLTLDPKVEQLRINPIRELHEKLTALARQKGVVVESAGDGHAARHLDELDGGGQTVGPLTGKHIFIMEAREGFRYHYATGKADGVVQVQMDYLGKRGKDDEEVALYYYEVRVEEWSPGLEQTGRAQGACKPPAPTARPAAQLSRSGATRSRVCKCNALGTQ